MDVFINKIDEHSVHEVTVWLRVQTNLHAQSLLQTLIF